MKDNTNLVDKNILDAFRQYLLDNLSLNLSHNLCNMVANLLAIDYFNRLKAKPDITNYMELCVNKIKQYLGFKVISNDSFSQALSLFIIAITPEQQTYNDSQTLLNQYQDVASNITIKTCNVTNTGEIKLLKSLLKENINYLDLITTNTAQFCSIIATAVKESNNSIESIELAKSKLEEYRQQTLNKLNFKSFNGRVSLVAGVIALGMLGGAVNAFILSALIVPATVITIGSIDNLKDKKISINHKQPKKQYIGSNITANNIENNHQITKNIEKNLIDNTTKEHMADIKNKLYSELSKKKQTNTRDLANKNKNKNRSNNYRKL